MSAFPLHDKAVALAKQDLGVHEIPDGSNTSPKIVQYQHATWLGGTGWPWCVAFWLSKTLAAGLKMPYLGAGAYALLDWGRKVGWDVPLARAMPGDAVIWNVGEGHCSMFLAYDKGAGSVMTIDGNVSNEVAYRTRPASLVRGVVHVPEKPTVKPPKARPPVFEVVTSEGGHKIIYVSGARAIGKRLARFLRQHPGGVVIRRKRAKK